MIEGKRGSEEERGLRTRRGAYPLTLFCTGRGEERGEE